MSFLKKAYETVFGTQNQSTMKEFAPIVEAINEKEAEFAALSNEQIQAKTAEFKERLKKGETLDDLLVEAFATVREAGKRVMGMRHYDVQLIGGIAMHRGMIAEMRTGEGKTLVATLPAYLNALEEKGVHVITVNDYLAKRDAVWMGQLYTFLGLTTGIVQGQRVSYAFDDSNMDISVQEASKQMAEKQETIEETETSATTKSFHVEDQFLRSVTRQEAYACDITYGTNNEFGFDYLRDNMVQSREQMVMRSGNEMHYAIIDEIDSILIDESRTPLIISAPAGAATEQYYQFAKLATGLVENTHYNLDEKLRSVTLTEDGISYMEQNLGVKNIYAEGGMQIVHHIEQALKAQVLFQNDKEYVVEDGEVVIIDEFTGRKMPGRRYSEGLHQAIEAKEGVAIQQESRTLATITFQNLFRMYKKLSGMTGTAITEEEEFRSIYKLDVLVIPTNKLDARIDNQDRIYLNEKAKYKAIVKQIKACREKGQPILIGTISVEKNEELSVYLTRAGIEHEVLNAKNHEREGEIIAQAGKSGAVTLATNMAGRGVDIRLGGASEDQTEKQKVMEAGGLFVLGTERHESRRIDNQLRGRSARQGDPGETQFFVSTEDDLMRIFAKDRLKTVMQRLKVPEDMPIEQPMITRLLEGAQKKVESHNYDIRKHLLNYDDILNKQRHVIYTKRRQILDIAAGVKLEEMQEDQESTEEAIVEQPQTLKHIIQDMIEQELEFIVSYHTNEQALEIDTVTEEGIEDQQGWNVKEIIETVQSIFLLNDEEKSALERIAKEEGNGKFDDVQARENMLKLLVDKANEQYSALEEQILAAAKEQGKTEEDAATMVKEIEKQVLLRAIDTLWVDHLVQMTYLRTGIGLRGYGQQDPLIEYKRESFTLFNQLQSSIQKEVVYAFYKVSLGLQLAPTIMSDDKMVLQGAQKNGEALQKKNVNTQTGQSKKIKMSKKERRKRKDA